jgi:hypothetical protein
MSNILRFVERAPNAAPLVIIEARRFLKGFRYHVKHPGDEAWEGMLDTYSLEGARASAEYWGKQVIETGPPEAFREGPG